MNEPAHDLDRIQRWMQAVITHPTGAEGGVASPEARGHIDLAAGEVERVVTRSRALTSLQRLEIYAGAYYARLLECLRDEFPVLARLIGQDVFDAFAFGYLQAYPSRSYTLNRLGANLPRYLAETRLTGDGPDERESWPDLLIDLATLEWTIGEVFDGAGVEERPLLDAEQLRSIPANRWSEARLVPGPCLRRLALRFPLLPLYNALRDGQDALPPEPSESYVALTRRNYVVRSFELLRDQYLLLGALIEGHPVGKSIGLVADSADADPDCLAADLRTWFHDWVAAGFFQAVADLG
jgi:hypothetical protein